MTTTPLKPPTPPRIALLLRKAGFPQAHPLPARRNTAGFHAIRYMGDIMAVLVTHWQDSDAEPDRLACAGRLREYAGALREAGYAVREKADAPYLRVPAALIVTAPESSKEGKQ